MCFFFIEFSSVQPAPVIGNADLRYRLYRLRLKVQDIFYRMCISRWTYIDKHLNDTIQNEDIEN